MKRTKYNLYSSTKEVEIFTFYFLALAIFYLWSLSTNYLGLSIGELDIHLGNFAYMGLLFLSIYLTKKKNIIRSLWIFFSTLASLDMLALMYIKNEENIPSNFLYDFPILYIILISMLITFFIRKVSYNIDFVPKKSIFIIFIFSILTMLIYHGANYYLKVIKNVPNEDRSIFIGDLEFHHINYGLLLLIFLPLFFKLAQNSFSKSSFYIYAFIGFIYGT
ncbi:MAG: hypothetical protein HF962_03925, partial [Sulfurovum sp.]|nr:hypothetical protein [Sulfurovum sp.]